MGDHDASYQRDKQLQIRIGALTNLVVEHWFDRACVIQRDSPSLLLASVVAAGMQYCLSVQLHLLSISLSVGSSRASSLTRASVIHNF